MNPITLYDATGAAWKSNIGPTINPVPADQYLVDNAADGSLVTLNVASKEMAGGLISADFPLPVGAQFFGLDLEWQEIEEDAPHKSRNEMDLKVTFAGGKQANGSLQWNATKGMWQLDPTGSGWVDTGFAENPSPYGVGASSMQSRFWSDGVHWSCTGLRVNGKVFVPGAAFQNLPMIQTNWSAGLHPQLQTECSGVPWFLRTVYTRVWVLASASAIGW